MTDLGNTLVNGGKAKKARAPNRVTKKKVMREEKVGLGGD